ncbi:MAG: hypothetical protein MHM6MM_006298 [Cercozoa sp. M6MM]
MALGMGVLVTHYERLMHNKSECHAARSPSDTVAAQLAYVGSVSCRRAGSDDTETMSITEWLRLGEDEFEDEYVVPVARLVSVQFSLATEQCEAAFHMSGSRQSACSALYRNGNTLSLPSNGGSGTAGQKLRLVSNRDQLERAADAIATGVPDAASKTCSRELSFAQFFHSLLKMKGDEVAKFLGFSDSRGAANPESARGLAERLVRTVTNEVEWQDFAFARRRTRDWRHSTRSARRTASTTRQRCSRRSRRSSTCWRW